jgi:transcriptional regulator with XRE-family HTH domain
MISLNRIGKTIARNTTILRRDANLNVSQMARLTGVSRRTLGRIERARAERRPYHPMFATVVKLADTAGVPIDTYATQNF